MLEVSSNHLRNVSMSNLMTSQVNLLDISGNPNLAVSSHDLEGVKYVCVCVCVCVCVRVRVCECVCVCV